MLFKTTLHFLAWSCATQCCLHVHIRFASFDFLLPFFANTCIVKLVNCIFSGCTSQRKMLSSLFYIYSKFTDAQDWLVSLWLAGEREYAPPTHRARPVLLLWISGHETFFCFCFFTPRFPILKRLVCKTGIYSNSDDTWRQHSSSLSRNEQIELHYDRRSRLITYNQTFQTFLLSVSILIFLNGL